jgi:purine/pyrimidine-nucleoside phosphorylase
VALRSSSGNGNVLGMPIPSEFSNVTAVAKANVYFDGKVVSHAIKLADGSKKTLGLIYAGEYHFGTDAPETMEMVAGACRVKLDGSEAWHDYPAGTFFKVPGKSGFTIAVPSGIAEYICSFG